EGPTGNNELNRSVMLTLSWTSDTTTRVTKSRHVKILELSEHWGLEILHFEEASLGVGAGYIRFRLESFGKTRRYEARLTGIGLDNPLGDFKDPGKPPPSRGLPTFPDDDPNPDKTYFHTGKPVSFDAFDKNEIIVWKLQGGVGIPETPVGVGIYTTNLKFS